MKSTGIVRRIDDLGRVVVPKEIRKTLRIHEGDPLELWLDKDCICFKKYNVLALFEDRLQAVVDILKDEDVSRKISEEDKAVVCSIVNMLLTKWKNDGGETDD